MGKKKKSLNSNKLKQQPSSKIKSGPSLNPLRFCLLFLGYLSGMLLLYVIWLLLFDRLAAETLIALSKGTARSVTITLNLLGLQSLCQGTQISLPRLQLEIVPECTGIYETLILSTAVLASPVRVKYRLAGVIFSIAAIYLINLLRMATLAVVGQYSQSLFELLHLYILRVSSLLIILVLWILWMKKVVKYAQ